MNKIPDKLKKEIKADPYMKKCIHTGYVTEKDCKGRITWEHAFIYAGKQIQAAWAILPVCYYHHLGAGFNKKFNQHVALSRATQKDLEKYPRVDWGMVRGIIRNNIPKKIKEYPQRTLAQNRALHKMLSELADELNGRGITLKAVITIIGNLEVRCTTENMKDIFKTIMDAQLKIKSTKELNTKQVDEVFDEFTIKVLTPLKVDLQFPSIERVMNEMQK